MFNDIKNIIFDIDGTLVNTKKFTIPAFRNVILELEQENLISPMKLSDKEILKYVGYTINEIWMNLLKTNNTNIINRATKYLDKYENLLMEQLGKEIFFDGVFETLKYLKEKNKTIFLLSNCNIEYMKSVLSKGLEAFVDYPHCAEMYNWKQKEFVIKLFIEKYKTKNFIMIGDRYKDIEAAIKNDIPSIGCRYGYGVKEIKKASIIINDIREIKNYF